MNFQTIVDRMLHRITKGTDIYDPYVNGEGDVLDTKRIKRSD